MTHEQFVMWLHGYLELTETEGLTPRQVEIIKEHMNVFFKKVTKDIPKDEKKDPRKSISDMIKDMEERGRKEAPYKGPFDNIPYVPPFDIHPSSPREPWKVNDWPPAPPAYCKAEVSPLICATDITKQPRNLVEMKLNDGSGTPFTAKIDVGQDMMAAIKNEVTKPITTTMFKPRKDIHTTLCSSGKNDVLVLTDEMRV